jgi:hypothetical protein
VDPKGTRSSVLVDGEPLMFRVQDHLRNMELDRKGLTALVENAFETTREWQHHVVTLGDRKE